MTEWSSAELATIAAVEEVHSPSSGGTNHRATLVWCGDRRRCSIQPVGLPIRGAWFRATLVRGRRRIVTAGVVRDLAVVDADPDLTATIDSADRRKYCRRYAATLYRITSAVARPIILRPDR